jgi:hypothetical protein
VRPYDAQLVPSASLASSARTRDAVAGGADSPGVQGDSSSSALAMRMENPAFFIVFPCASANGDPDSTALHWQRRISTAKAGRRQVPPLGG